MIGQELLIKNLSKYNLSTFPTVTLLIGYVGSGRHTLAEYISHDILHLECIDVTAKLDSELIEEIKTYAVSNVFIIDVDKITERNQNMILKLLEELNTGSKIILLSTSEKNVLPTVLNRSMVYVMDPYNKIELSKFIASNITNPDMVLKFCDNPGQIKSINENNLNVISNLCSQIVNNIDIINLTNLLLVTQKVEQINDTNLFFRVLYTLFYDRYASESSYKNYYLCTTTKKYKDLINMNKYNTKNLMDAFLVELWGSNHLEWISEN